MLAVAIGMGLSGTDTILRRSTKGSDERNSTHRRLPRGLGADTVFCRGAPILCRRHDGLDLLLTHGRGQPDHHRDSESAGIAVVAEAAVEPVPGDVQDEEVFRHTDGVCRRSEPGITRTLPATAGLFPLQHRVLRPGCLLLVDTRHRRRRALYREPETETAGGLCRLAGRFLQHSAVLFAGWTSDPRRISRDPHAGSAGVDDYLRHGGNHPGRAQPVSFASTSFGW